MISRASRRVRRIEGRAEQLFGLLNGSLSDSERGALLMEAIRVYLNDGSKEQVEAVLRAGRAPEEMQARFLRGVFGEGASGEGGSGKGVSGESALLPALALRQDEG